MRDKQSIARSHDRTMPSRIYPVAMLLLLLLVTDVESFLRISDHLMTRSSHSLQMRGKSDDSPKKFTKSNLPSKDCIVCNRPFEWRKKWERCWDEVKYCSERCRRDAKGSGGGGGGGGNEDSSSGNNKFKFSLQDDDIQYGSNRGSQEVAPFITNIFSSGAALLPPISMQQREIHNYQQNIRKSFGFAAALLALTTTTSTIIPSVAIAAGTTRPTKKEIDEMFLDNDWDTKASVLRKSSYRRLDETPDNLYYTNPRIVEHIDEKAVLALTAFHGEQLKSLSAKLYNENKKLDILDICSSWTSHLPLRDYPIRNQATLSTDNKVVGVGMNREELNQNTQLSESLVLDLNLSPQLPFPDASFDAILLQLSIDYLTRPLDLLSEAVRVLRPRGAIFISFSNRVFIDKAIAGWTGKSDLDHIQTVGDYLHHSSSNWVEPFKAVDLSPTARSGDPLYAIIALKK